MSPFWKNITRPILQAINPQALVEIGCDRGRTTRRLLEFCRTSGAVLHVIDPAPRLDVDAWQLEYGDTLSFHRETSLQALPSIRSYDAVLIDGDHNWYTVRNELRIIEATCRQEENVFPLVFLHDVGWPYGRRDMYYDPMTIPADYRRRYLKKGLRPNSDSPVDEGGVNRRFCNAVDVSGERNGVLTAVEDFVDECPFDLELIVIPGFHGLGILIPSELISNNSRLADVVFAWQLPSAVADYLEQLEKARVNALVRLAEAAANDR